MFCIRLNEPHGKPKCQYCRGLQASLHSWLNAASLRMSPLGSYLPFLSTSNGVWTRTTFRALKVFVRWPVPAKISLKLHSFKAGWFSWQPPKTVPDCSEVPLSCLSSDEPVSVAVARHGTLCALQPLWPSRLTARHRSLLDLRFLYSLSSGPKASSVTALGVSGGGGILRLREG